MAMIAITTNSSISVKPGRLVAGRWLNMERSSERGKSQRENERKFIKI
jgi:hypothetical protein